MVSKYAVIVFFKVVMAYEAKQYAARNRQGSDWFTHGSSTPSSSPAAKAEVSEVNSAAVTDQVTSPAKNGDRTQIIKPKSDSNSWYVVFGFFSSSQ